MSFLPPRLTSLLNTERLGLAGVIGIGLWLFCLSFSVGTLLPTREEAHTLRAEESQLVTTLSSFKGQAVMATHADITTTHSLPALVKAPELVDQLDAIAVKNGLVIDHTSYHLEEDEHQRRIQVSLPLKASYPTLRAYLREALALGEGATLDGLNLQRAQSSDPMVNADLRLSYYFSAP